MDKTFNIYNLDGIIYWGYHGKHTIDLPHCFAFRSKPVVLNRWMVRKNFAFKIERIEATEFSHGCYLICYTFDFETIIYTTIPYNTLCAFTENKMVLCENKHAEQKYQFKMFFRNRLLEWRGEHTIPMMARNTYVRQPWRNPIHRREAA